MEEQIKECLANPLTLERLYRSDPAQFSRAFESVYPQISSQVVAQVWHERLAVSATSWGSKQDWILLASLALVAAFFVQIPAIFSISEDNYFSRNLSFLVMPGIGISFAYKQGLRIRQLVVPLAIFIFSIIFINVLPEKSTTLLLTCFHIPLLIWLVVGFIFAGFNPVKQMDFLRYHGDLVVMIAMIGLAGGLFTALTLNLFELIGIHIEGFYFDYLVLSALPSVPLLASFLVRQNASLVNKISPVIARIFTPIVTVMLAIFLCAIVYTGKDPYNDREFLLLFNGILIAAMALIFFSLGEATKQNASRIHQYFLLALATLAIIDNGIALSAIAFRLIELGITPNRLAVLGSNVLVMGHLMLVTRYFSSFLRGILPVAEVEKSMTFYLPVYAIWVAIVSFVFPIVV
jgi:hypothetical protein